MFLSTFAQEKQSATALPSSTPPALPALSGVFWPKNWLSGNPTVQLAAWRAQPSSRKALQPSRPLRHRFLAMSAPCTTCRRVPSLSAQRSSFTGTFSRVLTERTVPNEATETAVFQPTSSAWPPSFSSFSPNSSSLSSFRCPESRLHGKADSARCYNDPEAVDQAFRFTNAVSKQTEHADRHETWDVPLRRRPLRGHSPECHEHEALLGASARGPFPVMTLACEKFHGLQANVVESTCR